MGVQPRFAHADGHATVAFSADGSFSITTGSDGLIRLFYTSEEKRDLNALSIDFHTEPIFHLAVYGDHLVTCCEDGTVALFDVSTQAFRKIITRCSLPVRHAAFSPDGKRVAVASDEIDVKIVEVEDVSVFFILQGQSSSTKSVAFHPHENILLSACCDGSIRVWDVSGTPTCAKVIPGWMSPSKPEGPELGFALWRPDGVVFAIAKQNGIVMIDKTGAEHGVIPAAHPKYVTVFAWSSNGKYLATTGDDNKVVCWDVQTKKALIRHQHQHPVTGISWHPKLNTIAYVDNEGQYVMQESFSPSWENQQLSAAPTGIALATEQVISTPLSVYEDCKTAAVSGTTRTAHGERDRRPRLFDDDEDDGDLDDFVVDDDGAGYAEHRSPRSYPRTDSIWSERKVETTALQKPFQPGSTPIRGNRRYLAFNLVGLIYIVDQGTHSTVAVEFHDKSSHRDFHFADYYNFTMAYLGSRSAVFAAKRSGEELEDKPSTLSYRPFEGWSSKNDWLVTFDKKEDVEAVVLSSKAVVAATSMGYLRFFSNTGVQLNIFTLSRPVVSMAAIGELVLVVYHSAAPMEGSQCIEFRLYNSGDQTVLQSGPLPLTPKSTLAWLGFSETMIPAAYDSAGVLHVMLRQRYHHQAFWTPTFDSRQYLAETKKRESYWAVGVTEDKFMCITCKGEEAYPGFPKPSINEVELRMPLVHLSTNEGKLEERFLRKKLFTDHERAEAKVSNGLGDLDSAFTKAYTEMDKLVLQLIQAACKAEKTQRALDLTNMLHQPKSVDAAAKIAVFHHLPALAERMNQVKEVVADRHRRLRAIDIPSAAERDCIRLTHDTGLLDDVPPSLSASPLSGRHMKRDDEEEEVDRESLLRRVQPQNENVINPPHGEHVLPLRRPKATGSRVNPFASHNTTAPRVISKSNSFFDAVGSILKSSHGDPNKEAEAKTAKILTPAEDIKKRKSQMTLLGFAQKRGAPVTKKQKQGEFPTNDTCDTQETGDPEEKENASKPSNELECQQKPAGRATKEPDAEDSIVGE